MIAPLPHIHAVLCKEAYQDHIDLSRYVGVFDTSEFIEVGEAQCHVLTSYALESTIVFRGTEVDQIEDISADLRFQLVDAPLGGQVHAGFSEQYHALNKEIQYYLQETGTISSVVAGHSLGGGMAVVCAARLASAGHDIEALYTYGCPRVGDTDFADALRVRVPQHYRFVNNNDIVTRIPPRICGYTHFGQLHYFTEEGELVREISAWDAFLDRMHGRIDDIGEWGTDGAKDHSIDRYCDLTAAYARSLIR